MNSTINATVQPSVTRNKNRLRLSAMALAMLCLPALALAESKQLLIYTWANYIPPKLIQRFESETGIKVTSDVYASNDAMLAKLQAGGGGYDIVVPSNSVLASMIRSDMLLKIETSKLPNYKNVIAPHDHPSVDKNLDYSAPYSWGSTGFTYDSAKVPGGKLTESWKEFFEPRPELVGKIAALDDMGEMYTAGAMYLGFDTCTENPADAQKIQALLEKQKPSVKIYSSTGTIDRSASGEVLMHQHWSGAARKARAKLASLVYVYPAEGANLWGDFFAVPKGSPNPDNAKTFINWMMEPKNAGEASNFNSYGNAIRGSEAFMDVDVRNSPEINPPASVQSRLRPVKDCSPKARELRDTVWTKLRR